MFSERKRRRRRRKQIKIAIVVIFLAALSGGIYGMKRMLRPLIILEVQSLSMLQEEELPEITAKAKCKKERHTKKLLSKEYTIQKLIDDLNAGNGYQLKYDVDTSKEGSYKIQIVLEKKLKEKIDNDWKGKIKFQIESGVLKVKNKYGAWDGKKFKKLDDTYAASEFIPSKGKMYYFDEDGKMVTGWQKINNFRYFFNKKGEMSTGWKKTEDGKYYLQEDGKMTVGWEKIGKDTYYFDKEGKMLTGKQKVFQLNCEFGKDGKLKSKERMVDPNKPMIALTFDDGPGKYTDTLLQKLEECGARATFFMLGGNAKKYPDVIKRMEEIGCELGNHSNTHTSLIKLDDAGVKQEVSETDAAIAAAVGHGSSMLRPPYGEYNDNVKALVGHPLVMWSVDTLDWKKKDAAKIKEYVLSTVSDGDIVLLHDIHSFSVDASLELIPELIEQGYQLVTVSELAEARGIDLEDGERYSQFYK